MEANYVEKRSDLRIRNFYIFTNADFLLFCAIDFITFRIKFGGPGWHFLKYRGAIGIIEKEYGISKFKIRVHQWNGTKTKGWYAVTAESKKENFYRSFLATYAVDEENIRFTLKEHTENENKGMVEPVVIANT